MAWLMKQGTPPEVIPNGSKVMCIKSNTLNIRVIDSFNFLPMALSKLPPCFGLSELKKGYFPHFFNTPQNQDYIGPLPAASFYGPDSMISSAREKFMNWHKEHENDVFHFQKEMEMYCRYDIFCFGNAF